MCYQIIVIYSKLNVLTFTFLFFYFMNELKWSESKKTFGMMLLICGPIPMPKCTLKSQENFKEATKSRQNLKLMKKTEKIIKSPGQLQWFFIKSIKFDTKIFQVLVGNYKKLVLPIPIMCM